MIAANDNRVIAMRLDILIPAAAAAMLMLAAGCGRSGTGADEPPAADATAPAAAEPARTPSPDGARVYFESPRDGDVVTSPVRFEFGAESVDIVPAGTARAASGHHHLIIDAELPDLSQPIPATQNYRHFGDGSTSAEIELPPGEHRLRLLLGDHLHVPHEPPVMSEPVTIVVE
ncbi:MAG: DUF4399 domain-containing protein [Gammaproteobacteria bacterium]